MSEGYECYCQGNAVCELNHVWRMQAVILVSVTWRECRLKLGFCLENAYCDLVPVLRMYRLQSAFCLESKGYRAPV